MTFISKVIKYVIATQKKLCYSLNIVRGMNRMKKEERGIFEAKDLACYIKEKYYEYTNGLKSITPIKMQKALYFCFAFWSGFVNKGKIDSELFQDQNDRLFDDRIEAWSYGPVVPNVYFNERESLLFRKKSQEQEAIKRVEVILNGNQFLAETLDAILNDVFEVSDFKLVNISHMDKSWQNHFHEEKNKHNEEIPKEEIINEYTTRKCN